MISYINLIYSFIISLISILYLRIYEKIYYKQYSLDEYLKIFLIILLSCITSFYIKSIVNPLIYKFNFYGGDNLHISNNLKDNLSFTNNKPLF